MFAQFPDNSQLNTRKRLKCRERTGTSKVSKVEEASDSEGGGKAGK